MDEVSKKTMDGRCEVDSTASNVCKGRQHTGRVVEEWSQLYPKSHEAKGVTWHDKKITEIHNF